MGEEEEEEEEEEEAPGDGSGGSLVASVASVASAMQHLRRLHLGRGGGGGLLLRLGGGGADEDGSERGERAAERVADAVYLLAPVGAEQVPQRELRWQPPPAAQVARERAAVEADDPHEQLVEVALEARMDPRPLAACAAPTMGTPVCSPEEAPSLACVAEAAAAGVASAASAASAASVPAESDAEATVEPPLPHHGCGCGCDCVLLPKTCRLASQSERTGAPGELSVEPLKVTTASRRSEASGALYK